MFGLNYDDLMEAVEEKIQDETVSTKMKEALIKLEVGLLSVRICEFGEELAEKRDVHKV